MSDEKKTEETPEQTPIVLVKGHQPDETWEEFEQRVIKQFRDAGLFKGGKGPRPKPDEE